MQIEDKIIRIKIRAIILIVAICVSIICIPLVFLYIEKTGSKIALLISFICTAICCLILLRKTDNKKE